MITVCVCQSTVKDVLFLSNIISSTMEGENSANAVSHLIHIDTSNVSKLYIIRQFITWRLQ